MPSDRVRELAQTLTRETPALSHVQQDNVASAVIIACDQSDRAEPDMTPEDRALFHDFVQDVFDYVRHMSEADQPVRATNWQDLSQESLDWHLQLTQRATPQEPGPTWVSLLNELEQGQLRAVALTNQYELAQEGQIMQHCVGTYARRCSNGLSRIFSVRHGDDHVATGEIIPQDAAWRVNQVRGPGNIPATTEADQLMQQVASQYTRLNLPRPQGRGDPPQEPSSAGNDGSPAPHRQHWPTSPKPNRAPSAGADPTPSPTGNHTQEHLPGDLVQWQRICNHRVPVINETHDPSPALAAILALHPQAPFAGAYRDLGNDQPAQQGQRHWTVLAQPAFDLDILPPMPRETRSGSHMTFIQSISPGDPWPHPVQPPPSHREDFLRELAQDLSNHHLEHGMDHPAEHLLARALSSTNAPQVLDWLLETCGDHQNRRAADIVYLLGLQEPRPGTPEWRAALVSQALTSPDPETRDNAATAAHLWEEPHLAQVLEAHTETQEWLREYIQKVIADLRS